MKQDKSLLDNVSVAMSLYTVIVDILKYSLGNLYIVSEGTQMIGFVCTTPKFTVNALNFKLCMHLP